MQIKLVVKSEQSDSATRTHTFDELLITIGNSPAATVFINDRRVAPEQAVIINEDEQPVFISQSKGTIYNGREIEQSARREVESGDRIQIGGYSLTVLLEAAGEFRAPEQAAAGRGGANGARSNSSFGYAEEKTSEQTDIRSFADILNSLRKEEDQFYFQIVGDSGEEKERVPINAQEISLGWNSEKGVFTTVRENITEPQAVVRKDWSGVTIYPQGAEAILLNNSLLEAGKRLKNGDNLVFSRRLAPMAGEAVTLVFCEPAALVELNSILPEQLLNTALETNLTPGAHRRQRQRVDDYEANGSSGAGAAAAFADAASETTNDVRYFGYFTAVEISIMIFATILTAALTFVLLELS